MNACAAEIFSFVGKYWTRQTVHCIAHDFQRNQYARLFLEHLWFGVELSMRPSPSIVPDSGQNIYLVLDDFGRNGRGWREADVEHTRLENVITSAQWRV
jgi:hypothetical protein